jgi:hypothetical protein
MGRFSLRELPEMMSPIRFGGAVLALALLAGCAGRGDVRATAPSQLAGMADTALMSCAGVPDRQGTAADGARVYVYRRAAAQKDGSSVQIGLGGGGRHVGGGVGFSLPIGDAPPDGCEATFTMRDGKVASLFFTPGQDDASACYTIVENCLPARPARQ